VCIQVNPFGRVCVCSTFGCLSEPETFFQSKNVWLRPLPGPSPGGGTCQSAQIWFLEAKSEGTSLDEHSCPALRLKDFFVRLHECKDS
jgi:hypothetical protein